MKNAQFFFLNTFFSKKFPYKQIYTESESHSIPSGCQHFFKVKPVCSYTVLIFFQEIKMSWNMQSNTLKTRRYKGKIYVKKLKILDNFMQDPKQDPDPDPDPDLDPK